MVIESTRATDLRARPAAGVPSAAGLKECPRVGGVRRDYHNRYSA